MKQLDKLREILKTTFADDPIIKREVKHYEDGSWRPILSYQGKGFFSPSKMLSYKSKQIYTDSGKVWDAYIEALEKGREYHKLFDLLTHYKPALLPPDHQTFADAITTFYKKYQLTPVVNEYVLWDEKTRFMCIVDCIALDKDGNLTILELKTYTHIDLKKELIGHFQTFIAQSILKNKLEGIWPLKTINRYILHYDGKKLSIKEGKKELNNLAKHFQNIIDTEIAWENEIKALKDQNSTKNKVNDLLKELKENK